MTGGDGGGGVESSSSGGGGGAGNGGGGGGGTLPRVKPFLRTYEKEIVLYAYFKRLDYFSTECVYAPFAARRVRGAPPPFFQPASRACPRTPPPLPGTGAPLTGWRAPLTRAHTTGASPASS